MHLHRHEVGKIAGQGYPQPMRRRRWNAALEDELRRTQFIGQATIVTGEDGEVAIDYADTETIAPAAEPYSQPQPRDAGDKDEILLGEQLDFDSQSE